MFEDATHTIENGKHIFRKTEGKFEVTIEFAARDNPQAIQSALSMIVQAYADRIEKQKRL